MLALLPQPLAAAGAGSRAPPLVAVDHDAERNDGERLEQHGARLALRLAVVQPAAASEIEAYLQAVGARSADALVERVARARSTGALCHAKLAWCTAFERRPERQPGVASQLPRQLHAFVRGAKRGFRKITTRSVAVASAPRDVRAVDLRPEAAEVDSIVVEPVGFH